MVPSPVMSAWEEEEEEVEQEGRGMEGISWEVDKEKRKLY